MQPNTANNKPDEGTPPSMFVEILPRVRRPPIITALAICYQGAAAILGFLCVKALLPDLQDLVWLNNVQYWASSIVQVFPTPLNFYRIIKAQPSHPPTDYLLSPSYSLAMIFLARCSIAVAVGYGLWKRKNWARIAAGIVSLSALIFAVLEIATIPLRNRAIYDSVPLLLNPAHFLWQGFALIPVALGLVVYLFRPATAAVFRVKESFLQATQLPLSPKRASKVGIANGVVNVARVVSILMILTVSAFALRDLQLLPYLVVALVLQILPICIGWKKPSRFALGVSQGYFLIGAIVGGAWLLMLPFLAMLSMGGLGPLPLFLLIGVPAHLGGFIAATVASCSLPRIPASHAGKWSLGVLTSLVFGSMVVLLFTSANRLSGREYTGYHPPNRKQMVAARDAAKQEDEMRALITAYGKCLFIFAENHRDEGYPGDLHALGPGQSNCLTPSQLEGFITQRYNLKYTTAPDHPRNRFELHMTKAQTGKPSLALDEQGIYRRNGVREHSFAPIGHLTFLANCIEDMRYISPQNTYPRELRHVLEFKNEMGTPCLASFTNDVSNTVSGNQVQDRDSVFIYMPSADGQHYNLYLKPAEWGQKYFRTYVIDDSGITRVTAENRLPNDRDQQVEICEWSECDIAGPRMELFVGKFPEQGR